MKFRQLDIGGVWLIEPDLYSDERGVFRRHYCREEFAAHGIHTGVAQGNVSENRLRHTLRGFHYQIEPYAEGKTISCFSGALYDIVVDLRADSPTFMQWTSITLDATERTSLYLPPGCANAYITTQDNTVVHYYMSELYAPDSYRGFHYDDPSFGFRWPAQPQVISEKDRNLPILDRDSFTGIVLS